MGLTRRRFVYGTLTSVGLGFAGLHSLSGCALTRERVAIGYGSPIPDPEGILNLPQGFRYKIISRAGSRMSDGLIVPAMPDGMAAFAGQPGKTILVRNHEVSSNQPATSGAFGANNELLTESIKSMLYDSGHGNPCLGGTTTVVVDNESLEIESEFLSLGGTLRNCAGGLTPRGSWITCEETEELAGEHTEHDHGFAFEVKASPDGRLQEARPIREMGRFYREAVAVDPATGIVYQTEDKSDGLFYRFVPNDRNDLHKGGRLQALALLDQPRANTRNWESMVIPVGQKMFVEWIDLKDAHTHSGDLRYRGFQKGAAMFARAEGIWYGDGTIYFACTNGGRIQKGQIWKLHPGSATRQSDGTVTGERESIELFIQPDEASLLENADNLTVSPWGDLFICEDGPEKQNIVGVTPSGTLYRFAENAVSLSEFAGVTFSPDGSILFVNIQGDGLTFAITGPWRGRSASRALT